MATGYDIWYAFDDVVLGLSHLKSVRFIEKYF